MTGSNASKKISVFGVTIESNSELCRLLGYSAPIGKTIIFQRYGNYENFIKRRYKIDSDEQAKTKLLELMGQKDEQKEQKAYIDDSPIVKCARAFVTACINKGLKDDKSLLDGLMMAFNISDSDAVKAQIDKIKAGL